MSKIKVYIELHPEIEVNNPDDMVEINEKVYQLMKDTDNWTRMIVRNAIVKTEEI